jgi:outer membrane protein assembly factor BamB
MAPVPRQHRSFTTGGLFTLGISGIVTAFDAATGTRLWQTDAPAEQPYFSAACSPIADGSLVIVHPGNYGPLTRVRCGDWRDQMGRWRWRLLRIADHRHPRWRTAGRHDDAELDHRAVSLPDGVVLWKLPWPGGTGGPTPVIAGETIIVSTGQGTTGVRAFRRDGAWVAETAWQTKDVSMYISTPVVIGGTMYGLSTRSSGQYFALDTATGHTLWLGQPRQAANTALVKAAICSFT